MKEIISRLGSKLFAPPIFDDPDQTLTARQIFSIVRAFILSVIFLQIVQIAIAPTNTLRILLLLLATVVVSFVLLEMVRRGHVRWAALLLVASLWLLITYFSWTASGLGARAAWGYFIVVFIAAMLLGRRVGLLVAVLCSAATLFNALASPDRSGDPIRFWLINSLYLAVVLLLQNLASRSINESLASAHSELRERRLVEAALRASDERFKQLSSLVSEGIMIHVGGIILDANQAFAELAGYANPDQLMGKSGTEIISFTAESRQHILANMRTDSNETFEVKIIKADGSLLALETDSKKITYRGRQASLVSMRDVSERKQAEREKEQIISLQKATIESTADGILVIDHAGKVTDSNQRFAQMWCIPDDVLATCDDAQVLQFVLDQLLDPQGFLAKVNELYAAPDQESFDLLQFKDGRCFERYSRPQLISGQPVGRVWSFRDISERKLAEQRLLESERRYRTLFESAGDAIFLLLGNQIVDCNSRTLEVFDCTREQIIDLPISRFHPPRQPDGSDSLLRAKEKNTAALNGDPQFFEWRHVRYDGTSFDAEVNLTRIELVAGNFLLAIVRDISERKGLEEQLRQAQKMEAVGILAGGIAHDFNNILSSIVGYASLMQMLPALDKKLKEYLERILASTERAASLTHSLLSFSRKQAIDLQPVDINDTIFGFHQVLARLIGEDIDFKLNLANESLVVDADIRQIEQVLMNLAANSRDAMPHGGKLTISTRSAVLAEEHGNIPNGSYAVISLSDTGTGMDNEIQSHLFEPFFTTKEVGKGTGLGLAIVYGIIKNHQGFIKLESEAGRSTTFHIYLPLRSLTVRKGKHRKQLKIPRGTETILLVEDDAAVRHATRAMLEEFGYTVLEAADGQEALAVFAAHRDQVRLLLCDLIMPKKNGKETRAGIVKLKPEIKTLFMSGYTSDIIARKGILEPGMHLLLKPLHPSVLLEKIRQVLDT